MTAVEATLAASPVWAHFINPPASGGSDPTIVEEFVRLIDAVSEGAAIRCAIHSITQRPPADALVAARERGVDVEVVVDGSVARSDRAGARRLRDLGRAVRFCTDNPVGGCVTTATGNMHAKFLTLTETTDPAGEPRRDVSWFGSANLTGATGMRTFNNTVTVYEDAALRAGFDRYFAELWNERHYPHNDFYKASVSRGYYRGAAATIFASPDRYRDLVRGRLNDFSADRWARIRVAQAQFTDGRIALATLLAAHKRRGARVWVLVGMTPEGRPHIGGTVRNILRRAGIPVRKQRIHDKYVAVRARFGGGERQYRVYTGSHNWTRSATRDNDEVFVRMAKEVGAAHPLYDGFRAHFIEAYEDASAV